MIRRLALLLLTGLAVVGTAVAGYSFAGVTSPTKQADPTQVTVHAGEYYFILSQSSVPVGTVVFNIVNDGDVTHDFSIAGQTSATISSHDTTTLTVTFTKPGDYSYLCTIGEHAVYGMQGILSVTGSAVTTTTTTKATTTTKTPPPPPPPPQVVNVSEKEFSITLTQGTSKVTWVKPGDVHFMVTNNGKIPHNFVIAGQQTLVLSPGKSQELDVTLTLGSYPYLCSITGHAALGMKGTLIVSNTAPKPPPVKTTTVAVTMREFKFTLSKKTVPHGIVIFKLINRGKLAHDFKIAGHKSALIKPGKTGTLKVTISKKGKYAYLCTVRGHAKAGMKGTLRVT
jgi:plastocyanin